MKKWSGKKNVEEWFRNVKQFWLEIVLHNLEYLIEVEENHLFRECYIEYYQEIIYQLNSLYQRTI